MVISFDGSQNHFGIVKAPLDDLAFCKMAFDEHFWRLFLDFTLIPAGLNTYSDRKIDITLLDNKDMLKSAPLEN